MSTPTPNPKPAEAATPPNKPIDLLQTQPSLLYANLHPILLLSLLLVNFKNLVNNPVSTLLALAPIVTAIQAVYCVICLPPAGQMPVPAPKPGQKKKAAKPAQDIWAKVVVSVSTNNRVGTTRNIR